MPGCAALQLQAACLQAHKRVGMRPLTPGLDLMMISGVRSGFLAPLVKMPLRESPDRMVVAPIRALLALRRLATPAAAVLSLSQMTPTVSDVNCAQRVYG